MRCPASKLKQVEVLKDAEFRHIQELSGHHFTWDAASDDEGLNAHCKDFSCPTRPFQQQDVAGQHVWMHPPIDQVESFLQHFHMCWQKAPTATSGCVLLPSSLTHCMTSVIPQARVLEKYRQGSRIFEARCIRENTSMRESHHYTLWYFTSQP